MSGIEAETIAVRSLLPALGDADQIVRNLGILDLPAAGTVLGRSGEPIALRGIDQERVLKPGHRQGHVEDDLHLASVGGVDERAQSRVVAKIFVDVFIVFRAITGRQKLADRILVVLHDGVQQERGDAQVRQVIELGDHALQVASPITTLVAFAFLEKTVRA